MIIDHYDHDHGDDHVMIHDHHDHHDDAGHLGDRPSWESASSCTGDAHTQGLQGAIAITTTTTIITTTIITIIFLIIVLLNQRAQLDQSLKAPIPLDPCTNPSVLSSLT